MYEKYFKRLFDLSLSFFLIIIFSPILVWLFFLIWFFIGFPIFVQKRPGLNNKIFTIYKFKTLYDTSKKTSEKNRQSLFGNFLRRTGLDELPQLFNILENNMSFVGPRPLLVEYLRKFNKFEKKRHNVKPGITGLAQICVSETGLKSWKKSIELDVLYTRNVTFLSDLIIIFKTIKLIILKKKQYNDFKKFSN